MATVATSEVRHRLFRSPLGDMPLSLSSRRCPSPADLCVPLVCLPICLPALTTRYLSCLTASGQLLKPVCPVGQLHCPSRVTQTDRDTLTTCHAESPPHVILSRITRTSIDSAEIHSGSPREPHAGPQLTGAGISYKMSTSASEKLSVFWISC